MKVETFSQGKTADRNEDFFGHNDTSFVLADGATDKSGRLYNGQTGGEIVSRTIVEQSLANELNGAELVTFLNGSVHGLYQVYGILADIHDPKFRFTAAFTAVRVQQEAIRVTQVGDVGMRVNGQAVYHHRTKIDEQNAEFRASYIQQTGDIAGSRAHLMPELLKQFAYQNNPDHELGYGVVDGTSTPSKFIQTHMFDLNDIKTIELFTDGYFDIPRHSTISDWEKTNEQVEKQDPDKYLKYKSTKSKDDRTVAIIRFF